MLKKIKNKIYNQLTFYFGRINRNSISRQYLSGNGIEIGAMEFPLRVRKGVKVKYLDRISREKQLEIFPNYKLNDLVKVDIIDNGELLKTIPNESQDFVIANHFIEHCENPFLTIENILRVLKHAGHVFMAIPNKDYTFDKNRKITSIKHLLKDYIEGPEWSNYDHFYDFVKHTSHGNNKSKKEIENIIYELKQRNFSIHYHVWNHQSMIDMFSYLKNEMKFPFNIELSLSPLTGSNESIFILKKI